MGEAVVLARRMDVRWGGGGPDTGPSSKSSQGGLFVPVLKALKQQVRHMPPAN
jgi:hypothetical protein